MENSLKNKNLIILRGFKDSADFEIIKHIHNQSTRKETGKSQTVMSVKLTQSLISSEDRLRIAEIDNVPVGFIYVVKEGSIGLDEFGTHENRSWLFLGPTVLPEYKNTGTPKKLLQWLELYAKEKRISKLFRIIKTTNSQLKISLKQNGFLEAQSYFSMKLEMNDAPPPPRALPEWIEIYQYRGNQDFQMLWNIFSAAFNYIENINSSYEELRNIFSSLESPFIPILVEVKTRRAIGAIVASKSKTTKENQGFIATFGVLPSFQGKGIGSLLMERAIDHFWNSHVKKVNLSVRAKNQQALKIYERFGFKINSKQTMVVMKKNLEE
ncbi:MAG: GNAT family N-acetyltransferase [Candidatus Hodarchaeales archaeon]|jgi:ribosomal protein S18 acetylase RimI-like enzyme